MRVVRKNKGGSLNSPSKNNEILRKQNISKANVNKHIEHLLNEKKSKETSGEKNKDFQA